MPHERNHWRNQWNKWQDGPVVMHWDFPLMHMGSWPMVLFTGEVDKASAAEWVDMISRGDINDHSWLQHRLFINCYSHSTTYEMEAKLSPLNSLCGWQPRWSKPQAVLQKHYHYTSLVPGFMVRNFSLTGAWLTGQSRVHARHTWKPPIPSHILKTTKKDCGGMV